MRLRNIPGAREAVAASPFCVQDTHAYRGRWRELFPGKERLYLEIGCGKGRFLIETAALRPTDAFLGMERFSTVLYKALRKLPEPAPDNLRFLLLDAEILTEIFDRGEVDGIYLNFSDPWPKERHRERRLTSARFLRRYREILSEDAVIEFKTDNRSLFDFSLEEAEREGCRILQKTFDLHADEAMREGNVMTEYEERFVSAGHPVCKYVIQVS
ncbi:MAG: tRNA (guanosine(46)-N7)-methyltransferase TrmB [Lachnospiraceae bacterium]|nr:tRNA (guanosine(46)-N7)-methyltransferase TrmB [Lachnospiraceae bacterium]